jgi:hypothetical protein
MTTSVGEITGANKSAEPGGDDGQPLFGVEFGPLVVFP